MDPNVPMYIICTFITNFSIAYGFSFFKSDFKQRFWQYFLLGLGFVCLQLINIFSGVSFDTVYAIPISYAGMIVLYFIIFKENIINTMLSFFTGYVPVILWDMITLAFIALITKASVVEFLSNDWNRLAVVSLYPFLYFLLGKFVPFKRFFDSLKEYHPVMSLISSNILLYVLCFMLLIEDIQTDAEPSFFYIFFLITLVIGVNIMMVRSFIKNTNKMKQAQEYSHLKEEVTPLIQNNIQQQHDFKNHLATLKTFINNENSVGVKYIDSLSSSLQKINEYLKWNNPILGALIQRKIQEAISFDINFETISFGVDDQFPIEDYELVSVVSNLIDNALEATILLPINQRNINLTIGRDTNLFISVENSCDIDNKILNRIFQRSFSTKKNGQGLGLYNVKQIVEKSNGKIDVYPKANNIEIKIIF